MSVEFVKGHGTGNDFVLLPDVQGRLRVTPEAVRAVCDRHLGLGADGLIRVVPETPGGRWFMDYHNADGSIGEMCGNGARVFARLLRENTGYVPEHLVVKYNGRPIPGEALYDALKTIVEGNGEARIVIRNPYE